MPEPIPKPFSFIGWEECFHSHYDRYCQDAWQEWLVDNSNLYPADVPFARLPWNEQSVSFIWPDVVEQYENHRGWISVWVMRPCEFVAMGYFEPDESCEWEPLEYPLLWDDLGCILLDGYGSFGFAYSTRYSSQPISKLLADYHNDTDRSISHLHAEIVQACEAKSITVGSLLCVIYDFAWSGSPVYGKFCSGEIEFVGAFAY